jgi:hypothetical protein
MAGNVLEVFIEEIVLQRGVRVLRRGRNVTIFWDDEDRVIAMGSGIIR